MEISLIKINLNPNAGGNSGGGKLMEKSLTITGNGEYAIVPDEDYDGLSSVNVTAYITDASGVKDFSVIGYNVDEDTKTNLSIDADIAYSKSKYLTGAIMTIANRHASDKVLKYAPKYNLRICQNTSNSFQNCKRLEVVPRYEITTSCTAISNMFDGCSSLVSLDVTDWNVSKVTNANYFVNNCTLLQDIDVSNWNTQSLQNAYYMFGSCTSLASIDLSNWNTQSLQNAYYMFKGCTELLSIDLSNWNTQSLKDIMYFFDGCQKLQTINFSGWDFSPITNMKYAFQNCKALESLPLISLKNKGTSFGSTSASCHKMLYGCSGLKSFGGFIDTESVNWSSSDYAPFYSCSELETIEQFGVIKSSNFYINNCSKLTVESLMVLINALYDYVADGNTATHSFTIGSTNAAKLSDEQKAIATSKGWTIK